MYYLNRETKVKNNMVKIFCGVACLVCAQSTIGMLVISSVNSERVRNEDSNDFIAHIQDACEIEKLQQQKRKAEEKIELCKQALNQFNEYLDEHYKTQQGNLSKQELQDWKNAQVVDIKKRDGLQNKLNCAEVELNLVKRDIHFKKFGNAWKSVQYGPSNLSDF